MRRVRDGGCGARCRAPQRGRADQPAGSHSRRRNSARAQPAAGADDPARRPCRSGDGRGRAEGRPVVGRDPRAVRGRRDAALAARPARAAAARPGHEAAPVPAGRRLRPHCRRPGRGRGFNPVWTSPETLPTLAEFTDPPLPGWIVCSASRPRPAPERDPAVTVVRRGPACGAAMGRVPPALAAIRVAVRRGLADLPEGSLVLVACSGGADSLALAAGLAFVAPRHGLAGRCVFVDHGWTARLRPAQRVRARNMRRPGPGARGGGHRARSAPGGAGPRRPPAGAHGGGGPARGRDRPARATPSTTRPRPCCSGSPGAAGARSLAGMAPWSGLFRRPLLGLPRSLTRDAAARPGCPPGMTPPTPIRPSPESGAPRRAPRSCRRPGPGRAAGPCPQRRPAQARQRGVGRLAADALRVAAAGPPTSGWSGWLAC